MKLGQDILRNEIMRTRLDRWIWRKRKTKKIIEKLTPWRKEKNNG